MSRRRGEVTGAPDAEELAAGGARSALRRAMRWVDGHAPPLLVRVIAHLRPDLHEALGGYTLEPGGGWVRLLGWLVTAGRTEYRAVTQDPEFLALLRQQHPRFGLTVLQLLVYSLREDVRASHPLDGDTGPLRHWFLQHGNEEHRLRPFLRPRRPLDPSIERPFGVNLVGYAFGQLGIGEDLRMGVHALQSAGVPVSVLDFPPGPQVPQNDRSVEALVRDDAPYRFNIFCMTVLEQARFYATHGSALLEGRYNIGFWPWELERWPAAWEDLIGLAHEAWVSSSHTFEALAPVAGVPVLQMPMAVELGPVARRSRRSFGLPPDPFLFCFAFDLNSSMHRKNPQACVAAFLQAFPPGQDGPPVGLVIKAHAPSQPHPAWRRLKRLAASDPRIHVVEDTLPRDELLALYRACDCFVSLHRAEGFGRNIAEALALGLQVIATGYSGNVDFCRPPDAHLVRHRLVRLRPGQYAFGEGQRWAEPDVDHAAELMRAVAARPRRRRGRSRLDPAYATANVGATWRLRLHALRQQKP